MALSLLDPQPDWLDMGEAAYLLDTGDVVAVKIVRAAEQDAGQLSLWQDVRLVDPATGEAIMVAGRPCACGRKSWGVLLDKLAGGAVTLDGVLATATEDAIARVLRHHAALLAAASIPVDG